VNVELAGLDWAGQEFKSCISKTAFRKRKDNSVLFCSDAYHYETVSCSVLMSLLGLCTY